MLKCVVIERLNHCDWLLTNDGIKDEWRGFGLMYWFTINSFNVDQMGHVDGYSPLAIQAVHSLAVLETGSDTLLYTNC